MSRSKFNWKLGIPLALVFISPWMHWLVYHNLLLAWPELSSTTAHEIGISAAVAATLVTLGILAP